MAAPDHLSKEQFRKAYPPGRHDVPIDHVTGLRAHGLYRSTDKLQEDVAANGIKTPIQVGQHYLPWNQKEIAEIDDGHHRLHVAQKLGHSTVPVNVWSEADRNSSPGGKSPWEIPGATPGGNNKPAFDAYEQAHPDWT